MFANNFLNSVCAFEWYEHHRVLPILTKSAHWPHIFLPRRCLSGMEKEIFWTWYRMFCSCPDLLFQSIWLETPKSICWGHFWGHWIIGVLISEHSIEGHYGLPGGCVHCRHLYHGMEGCGTYHNIQLLWWQRYLDPDVWLLWSYCFCNFRFDTCSWQICIPTAICTSYYHDHLLCSTVWNRSLCSR